MPSKSLPLPIIEQTAKKFGLNVVGVSSAKDAFEEIENLKNWQEQGFAGEMDFMKRDPKLLTDPNFILPNFKSIVLFSINYSQEKKPKFKTGYGRIARYAWGKDYHKVLRKKLKLFVTEIQNSFSQSLNFRIFSDSVPLLERFYAKKSGLGFIGKNTLLINPKEGSFNFLAEVIWDLEIVDSRLKIARGSCKTCTRCLDNCPTNAFNKEYVLDARKCISYLTIEKRGILNEWEQSAIGEWVFGCDICQEVCPFNSKALKYEARSKIEEFNSENGFGGLINLKEILSIKSDQEFIKKFMGTSIMRTKREGLIRNALIVASNTHANDLLSDIKYLETKEENQVIVYHSRIALDKLSS